MTDNLRLTEVEFWLIHQKTGLLEQVRNIDHALAVLRGEKEPKLGETLAGYTRADGEKSEVQPSK